MAAASINTALHVTYPAAAEIAQEACACLKAAGYTGVRHWRHGPTREWRHALCIVALFEKNAAHAKTVLRRPGGRAAS